MLQKMATPESTEQRGEGSPDEGCLGKEDGEVTDEDEQMGKVEEKDMMEEVEEKETDRPQDKERVEEEDTKVLEGNHIQETSKDISQVSTYNCHCHYAKMLFCF